jgi:hypothetical protein
VRPAAALALAIACITPAVLAQNDPIAGTWELTSYEDPLNRGGATGLLFLRDGRFSIVYTMNEGTPQPDGRAHAGTYRVDGDRIIYTLDWDLHYVGGKGIVGLKGSVARPRFKLEPNALVVTYENGSVHRFRRAGADKRSGEEHVR